jgi:hypothetical protein
VDVGSSEATAIFVAGTLKAEARGQIPVLSIGYLPAAKSVPRRHPDPVEGLYSENVEVVPIFS